MALDFATSVLGPCYRQGTLGHFPGLKMRGYLLV